MAAILALALAAMAAPSETFRGFELGGPCPSGPEWALVTETPDTQSWTRADEKLLIGDVPLTSIE